MGTFSGTHKIYALVDPRFGDVRYVGKTSKKLRERLAEHIENPTNCRTLEWIRGLQADGLRPEIVKLQRAVSVDWQIAEMQWIAWFRARGDLLNVDVGGEIVEEGTGLDEVKREKAIACAAAVRANSHGGEPPPCLLVEVSAKPCHHATHAPHKHHRVETRSPVAR